MTQRFILFGSTGTREYQAIEDALAAGIIECKELGLNSFKIETRTADVFQLSWYEPGTEPKASAATTAATTTT